MVADSGESYGAYLIGAVRPNAQKRAKGGPEHRDSGTVPLIFPVKQPNSNCFVAANPAPRPFALTVCKNAF
jgi:hypothetical protein